MAVRYPPLFVTKHVAIGQRATQQVLVNVLVRDGLFLAFPPLVFQTAEVYPWWRRSECDKGK